LTSISLKELDEKAKNFPKNSTKKVLEILVIPKGANTNELKNILHTKNMSFDIQLITRASSKKFDAKRNRSKKNKNLLNKMNTLLTLKNLNNLNE